MITVNADDHPFMKRFHKPGEEKRMVVILDPKDYFEWLTVSVEQAKSYFRQWHGHLEGYPAPLARAPTTTRLPPAQDELF
jgi:putative SOS response-associated peptidase YedK